MRRTVAIIAAMNTQLAKFIRRSAAVTPAAFAFSLLTLNSSAQQVGTAFARDRAVPLNAYGVPLTTPRGRPLEYDRLQLQDQEASWIARGGTIDPGPRGGCEGSGVEPEWKWFDMGTGIGDRGLSVADALGSPEVVLACGGAGFYGSRYWQIRRFDSGTGTYQQRFTSPVYEPGIERLVAADFSGDGSAEVFVAAGGVLELWDQATHRKVGEFSCPSGVNALKAADVVPGGALELVLCTSGATQVRAADGALLQSFSAGGADFAVGQMDADRAIEIALSSGAVLDTGAGSTQWTYGDGFGSHVEAGDIDDDGLDEVLFANAWGTAWAIDVDSQLPKWSLSIFNVGATDLADVDDDGQLEFVIGEAQWGHQLIYDTTTRTVEASIHNPEHGTTETLCADADGDGVKEILWGAGFSSTGEDRFFVGDWVTETHKWSSIDLDGPFRAPTIVDLDGDGSDEILTISNESDSGYGSGRMLVFDAETFALQSMSDEVAGGLGWSGTHEVRPVDLDGDGDLEIVVATSRTYDGVIAAYDYDGSTFTELWTILENSTSTAFLDVEAADIDGDGAIEVVASSSNNVYIYDAATQALEWTSPFSLQAMIPEVAIANVDDDPALEVVALASDGDVAVWDGQTQATEALLPLGASTLDLAEQPMGPDVLRFGIGGDLVSYRHDGAAFTEISRVTLSSEAIESVTLRLSSAVFAGIDGTLRLFELGSGMEFWRSCRVYGDAFGDGVAFSDDYLVTSGLYGLVVFSRR